jgi:hypothetical protein
MTPSIAQHCRWELKIFVAEHECSVCRYVRSSRLRKLGSLCHSSVVSADHDVTLRRSCAGLHLRIYRWNTLQHRARSRRNEPDVVCC